MSLGQARVTRSRKAANVWFANTRGTGSPCCPFIARRYGKDRTALPQPARHDGGAEGEQWGAPNGVERRNAALTCADHLALTCGSCVCAGQSMIGISLTRKRSLVQTQYRPPEK